MLTNALPLPSTATQRELEAQETPVSAPAPGIPVVCHVEAPPTGLVLIAALPLPSTATQRELEAQETPVSAPAPGIPVVCHVEAPPTAGFVLTSAWPDPSTATHSDVEAHETPVSAVLSISAVLQFSGGAAPAGADHQTGEQHGAQRCRRRGHGAEGCPRLSGDRPTGTVQVHVHP